MGTVTEKDQKVQGVLDRKFAEKEISKRSKALLEKAKSEGQTDIDTNKLDQTAFNEVKESAKKKNDLFYIPYATYKEMAKTNAYWIEPLESPAVTARLEQIVNAVEKALPSFLSLTNQLS